MSNIFSELNWVELSGKTYYSLNETLAKVLGTPSKTVPSKILNIESVPGQTSIIRVGNSNEIYVDAFALTELFKKSRMPQAKVLLSYLINPKLSNSNQTLS